MLSPYKYRNCFTRYETIEKKRNRDRLSRQPRHWLRWGASFLVAVSVINAVPIAIATTNASQFTVEGLQLYREGTAEGLRGAIAKWETAVQLYETEGDRANMAAVLVNISRSHLDLGEYQQARETLDRALDLVETGDDRHTQATILMQLARVDTVAGNYQTALNTYDRALSLWQTIGYRTGEVETLNNLGILYANLGDSERALELYDRALEIASQLDSIPGKAHTLNNIGVANANLKRLSAAIEAYQQALELWEYRGSDRDAAKTLNNIGYLYAADRQYEKSLSYYDRALDLWEKTGDRAGLASTINNIGYSRAQSEQHGIALTHYRDALDIRRDIGDRPKTALSLYHVAVSERAIGNLDVAKTTIEEAIAIVETLRGNIASDELRTSFFASKQDIYEFYIDLLMELHQKNPSTGYDAAALQASEQARSRSLLDILVESNADIYSGVDPQLRDRERELKQQLDAAERRRIQKLSGDYTEEDAIALNTEVAQRLAEYQAIRDRIRTASPRYAALTQPQPLTLRQIQTDVLDGDTVLLEYFLGRDRSFLWAVTDDRLYSYALPPKATVEAAAMEFLGTITGRSRFQLPVIARSAIPLTQMLLDPAAEAIADKRLLVVADGKLNYIPFAALSASAEEYEPLVVRHEIAIAPSASALAVLRRQVRGRTSAPQTLMVLADPVFQPNDERLGGTGRSPRLPLDLERSAAAADINLARLPYTQQEAESIITFVAPEKRDRALGFAANRDRLANVENYRIVHFATHGILNPDEPSLSGLVLSLFDENGRSQNGFLRLYDIFNLDLAAELVVLSACNTGRGETVRGEGVIGLTRGFMYAGATRILMSLWSVDDRGTSELMVRFYRALLEEELSPSAALRVAQIELWETDEWQSPYYWSAFALQGEWKAFSAIK